jgi:hypothetical protein
VSPIQNKQVGVPRRFTIGTLLIITAMYALLFGGMKAMGLHPIWFITVAVFVTGVGAAQALLYGGKNPRKASINAGRLLSAIIYLVNVVCVVLLKDGLPKNFAEWLALVFGTALGTAIIAAFGMIPGYLVGLLTAAVFLWARWDQRAIEAEEQRKQRPLPSDSVQPEDIE